MLQFCIIKSNFRHEPVCNRKLNPNVFVNVFFNYHMNFIFIDRDF